MGLIAAFGALGVGAWTCPGFGQDAFPGSTRPRGSPCRSPSCCRSSACSGSGPPPPGRVASPRQPAALRRGGRPHALVGVLAGAVQAIEPIETLVDGDGTPLFGTTWSTRASYVVLSADDRRCSAASSTGRRSSSAAPSRGRRPRRGPAAPRRHRAVGLPRPRSPGCSASPAGPASCRRRQRRRHRGPQHRLGRRRRAPRPRRRRLRRPARRGPSAATRLPGDDPWTGHTLEWATSSPPPVGNFASLPAITSEAPLYDARHRTEEVDGLMATAAAASPLAPPRRRRPAGRGSCSSAPPSVPSPRPGRRCAARRLPAGAGRPPRRRAPLPCPTASSCRSRPANMGMATLAMSVVTMAWAVYALAQRRPCPRLPRARRSPSCSASPSSTPPSTCTSSSPCRSPALRYGRAALRHHRRPPRDGRRRPALRRPSWASRPSAASSPGATPRA